MFLLLSLSCGRNWAKKSAKYKSDTLIFSELPNTVIAAYENYFRIADGSQRYIVTDSNKVRVEHLRVVNPDFPKIGWNYGFYFVINKQKTYVSYYPRKGEPYVIDEEFIYWSLTLAITEYNYKNNKYVRRRWKKL